MSGRMGHHRVYLQTSDLPDLLDGATRGRQLEPKPEWTMGRSVRMSNYLPEDQARVVIDLLARGFSYRRIAAMTGTSRTTIERYAEAKIIGHTRDGVPIYGWKGPHA